MEQILETDPARIAERRDATLTRLRPAAGTVVPEYSFPLEAGGAFHSLAGDRERAAEEWEESLRRDPTRTELHKRLVQAHLTLARPREAVPHPQVLLRDSPRDTVTLSLGMWTVLALSDRETYLRLRDGLREVAPGNPDLARAETVAQSTWPHSTR